MSEDFRRLIISFGITMVFALGLIAGVIGVGKLRQAEIVRPKSLSMDLSNFIGENVKNDDRTHGKAEKNVERKRKKKTPPKPKKKKIEKVEKKLDKTRPKERPIKEVKEVDKSKDVAQNVTKDNDKSDAEASRAASASHSMYNPNEDNRILLLIQRRINDALRYPEDARNHMIQGESTVGFTWTVSGQVLHLRTVKSSGYQILDRAAIATVLSASRRFPRVKKDFAIVIPIAFILH